MPRRNQRAQESHEPLDLTPADIIAYNRTRPTTHLDQRQARIERAKREREAAERQRNARLNGGIDWSVCLVPGCGEQLLRQWQPNQRDHTLALPLCTRHLTVAYQQANLRANDALMVKANTAYLERKAEKDEERRRVVRKEWLERIPGHIYFVRLNGLVKAGWSRDVHERLRAYGPLVEVLCIYPGSRDDETNLHRQLRPALARGREWYEDGKIIADFVADILTKHGPPDVYDDWTKPKPPPIRTRKRVG